MQTLRNLAKKTEELKAEISREAKSKGKKEIKAHLDEIFAKFPDITGVRWRQYTPYFNDGDPCEFSVREAEVKINETGGDNDDGWEYSLPDKHKASKAIRDFSNLIQSTGMSDVMETVFGDHVEVIVTPKEVVVEDYEHD
jgi:hypothetical protein